MASSDRRFIKDFPVDFRVNFIHAGDYMISCSQDVSMDRMFINTKCSLLFRIVQINNLYVSCVASDNANPSTAITIFRTLPWCIPTNT